MAITSSRPSAPPAFQPRGAEKCSSRRDRPTFLTHAPICAGRQPFVNSRQARQNVWARKVATRPPRKLQLDFGVQANPL